jgi:hypothetical protein
MESDLDNHNLIENAKISRNYGSTLVRDLRERYGENFAVGHADTATLREVINRLDAASLNRLLGDLEKGQVDEVWRVPSGPFAGIGPLTSLRPDTQTRGLRAKSFGDG